MERIRQALEQVAKQREQTAESRSKAQISPKPASDGAHEPVESTLPTGLQYKQTRTIEIPNNVLLHNRLAAAVPDHPMRDAYLMLRTRILQEMQAKGWNCIAVTSPTTGCGKTLTAINLAISLAMEVAYTVLLVDGDLRQPSVHNYFGYRPLAGLSDHLRNDVPVSDILFSPSIERLVVLPGRESISNSAETLRSPKMVGLVNEFRTRYPDRIIVVDVPPVLAVDDTLAFAPYVDCMLMVVENGMTRKNDLKRSLDLLKDTPIIGTVLNKSEELQHPKY